MHANRCTAFLGLVALASSAMAACASGPRVEDTMVRETYATLRSAEAIGAEQVPDASLHLELAREQIQQAERLVEEGEHGRARRALAKARADAELAMTLTRASVARREAETAQARVAEIEGELETQEPTPQEPSEGSRP